MIKFRLYIFERGTKLSDYLEDSSIRITTEDKLCDLAESLQKYSPEAIIIDMGSFDTTSVLQFISIRSDIPIIVICSNENIKYQLYECGASDVLVSPLDKLELKYKINVRIKQSTYKLKRYPLGDLIYEADTGTLIKNDKKVVLPTLQNKIFTLLVKGYYESRVVQKEEIFNSMIDESGRIQNHIARLRYSLAYIESRKVMIETVYGRGYKLYVME